MGISRRARRIHDTAALALLSIAVFTALLFLGAAIVLVRLLVWDLDPLGIGALRRELRAERRAAEARRELAAVNNQWKRSGTNH